MPNKLLMPYTFVHVHGIVQVNGSKIDIFHWNQIVAFWGAVSDHFFFGFQTGTSHSCAVLLTNGKDYRFSEAFLNIEELSNTIIRQATQYLLPKAIDAYHAGTPVFFGNLSVSQQGISNGKLTLAWNRIEDFEVFQDAITVKTTTKRGRKTLVLSLKVKSLPNVSVLVALVNHVFAHNAASMPPGKASP
jgi:hypothetical protein